MLIHRIHRIHGLHHRVRHRHIAAFALAMAMALIGGWPISALAQTLYRCGNVYQDKPCPSGQPGKVVGIAAGGDAAASGKALVDRHCAQRGREAQKIVWSREAGALEEQLLEKANSAAEKELINDVYKNRGTSTAVRQAIEAECMAARQRNAQTALGTGAGSASAADQAKSDQAKPGQAAASAAASDASLALALDPEAQKKLNCAKLKADLDDAVSLQRRGGTMEEMDDLNQQRRDLDSRLRRTGC